MIRIITDSASDITIEEAKELGVEVVPLHVIFGPSCLRNPTSFST